MTARSFLKVAERYVIDNAPTLLTAFGVTGTLATAYLTGKASFRAAKLIQEKETERSFYEESVLEKIGPFGKKEKAALVWKEFIPPVISATTTITCIVGANTISQSRAAALAAAYAMSNQNLNEYKDKVRETFGIKKEQEVVDAVAQDRVTANQPPAGIVMTPGKVLCMDTWTGQYFESDMQAIRSAENDINQGILRSGDVATLNDVFEAFGMRQVGCGDEVGFHGENLVNLTFSHALSREGVPVLVVGFTNQPVPISSYFGKA